MLITVKTSHVVKVNPRPMLGAACLGSLPRHLADDIKSWAGLCCYPVATYNKPQSMSVLYCCTLLKTHEF